MKETYPNNTKSQHVNSKWSIANECRKLKRILCYDLRLLEHNQNTNSWEIKTKTINRNPKIQHRFLDWNARFISLWSSIYGTKIIFYPSDLPLTVLLHQNIFPVSENPQKSNESIVAEMKPTKSAWKHQMFGINFVTSLCLSLIPIGNLRKFPTDSGPRTKLFRSKAIPSTNTSFIFYL